MLENIVHYRRAKSGTIPSQNDSHLVYMASMAYFRIFGLSGKANGDEYRFVATEPIITVRHVAKVARVAFILA